MTLPKTLGAIVSPPLHVNFYATFQSRKSECTLCSTRRKPKENFPPKIRCLPKLGVGSPWKVEAFHRCKSVTIPSDSMINKIVYSKILTELNKMWSFVKFNCVCAAHTCLINRTLCSQVLVSHGDNVVTTSWDETIRLWNVKSGTCLLTLRGHTEGT